METGKFFMLLDSMVFSSGKDVKDVEMWLNLKRGVSASQTFPLVYKIAKNEFEIVPEVDASYRDKIWGYEIAPNVIMSKDETPCSWYTMNDMVKKCKLNGKKGSILTKNDLGYLWNEDVSSKIDKMNYWMINLGFSVMHDGRVWSSSEYKKDTVWQLCLDRGIMNWDHKSNGSFIRSVIAF